MPAFLGVNLLGVALAPLGGLLGGTLRAHVRRGDRPTLAPAGQQEPPSRIWVAAIIITVVPALLIGIAGLWLSTGAFSAVG
ncbi:MAG TPA: hypothetical protein VGP82_18360 [Ktedonobacterales bacterium]|jgi:hypothetical protein|nr:hypothetical protein [Ktedonobacterales bacterium]